MVTIENMPSETEMILNDPQIADVNKGDQPEAAASMLCQTMYMLYLIWLCIKNQMLVVSVVHVGLTALAENIYCVVYTRHSFSK